LSFTIGALVESQLFSGVGKVISLNEIEESAVVAFFESPIKSESRSQALGFNELTIAEIYDETSVYYLDVESGCWRRARYGGERPDGTHLILFTRDDARIVNVDEIYILNLLKNSGLNTLDFLKMRCTDSPMLQEWRMDFVASYIEQRAACKSIASILSSSVEIEPHQIAVVRRVLEDKTKRYLLGDEVGLGKTIEACLILREHILRGSEDALAIISVPHELKRQWISELTNRFYLGDLLDVRIFICSHEKLSRALEIQKPTMLVIDEAHQIAPYAWSDNEQQNEEFRSIAEIARQVNTCLLLSGTPLSGNEENFLAMLHLLAPDSYSLDELGRKKFKKRLDEREVLGGMFQALVPTNNNDTLFEILENLVRMFPLDEQLIQSIQVVKPLVDFMSEEEGPERTASILALRSYIGENYRIHQRMLRNRREDPSIAALFPGLAGCNLLPWTISGTALALDRAFDAFRDEHIARGEITDFITVDNYFGWINTYLTSPKLVADRAKEILRDEIQIKDFEREFLQELVESGHAEQISKDQALVDYLAEWLQEKETGKAVIFCGDQLLADLVGKTLFNVFGEIVVRHDIDEELLFVTDVTNRILVCDERGESGLNLHGGEKLLVHYSLPTSFTAIEQRNGRANRYSAAIFAKPVHGLVLMPASEGVYKQWFTLLDESVGIFDHTVAGLQYVLQELIDRTWSTLHIDGSDSLIKLSEELAGPDGLLEKESRKIRAQEELQSMDEEVFAITQFAEALDDADERAETQFQRMLAWIVRGLQFEQDPGDIPDTYRFRYQVSGTGRRTLVDVKSFLKNCITGIDFGMSLAAPVTSLMSFDRQVVSHGNAVYPFRYGQPFVDTIFGMLNEDTRGITTVLIRYVDGLTMDRPKVFFSFTWLVAGCDRFANPLEQRLADEQLSPQLVTDWMDQSGNAVNPEIMKLITSPYSKKPYAQPGLKYRDKNVKPDIWSLLEEYLPQAEWPRLVEKLNDVSHDNVLTNVTSLDPAAKSHLDLTAASVVVVVGTGT